MEPGEHINKYMLSMQVGSHGTKWTLSLETSNGEKHQLVVTDVERVMDLLRSDQSLYYDPKKQVLSTGWNDPGG